MVQAARLRWGYSIRFLPSLNNSRPVLQSQGVAAFYRRLGRFKSGQRGLVIVEIGILDDLIGAIANNHAVLNVNLSHA